MRAKRNGTGTQAWLIVGGVAAIAGIAYLATRKKSDDAGEKTAKDSAPTATPPASGEQVAAPSVTPSQLPGVPSPSGPAPVRMPTKSAPMPITLRPFAPLAPSSSPPAIPVEIPSQLVNWKPSLSLPLLTQAEPLAPTATLLSAEVPQSIKSPSTQTTAALVSAPLTAEVSKTITGPAAPTTTNTSSLSLRFL